MIPVCYWFIYSFSNVTATSEIYTLSLHDALPICLSLSKHLAHNLGNLLLLGKIGVFKQQQVDRKSGSAGMPRPISYAVFCLKKKNVDATRYGNLPPRRA